MTNKLASSLCILPLVMFVGLWSIYAFSGVEDISEVYELFIYALSPELNVDYLLFCHSLFASFVYGISAIFLYLGKGDKVIMPLIAVTALSGLFVYKLDVAWLLFLPFLGLRSLRKNA